ncbi:O-antigen ligase family protein [Bacteriovoracaceae bacterium]|nr:O-antigen ligase family protein [Bacteriovoracaceae bacterium]
MSGKKTLSWVKYGLISLLSIYPLELFISKLSDDKRKRILGFLFNIFLGSIFLATFYGLILKFFHFDLLTLSETTITRDLERNRGLTGIMRYSYGLSMAITLIFSLLMTRYVQPKFSSNHLRLFFLAVALMGLYLSYSRGALLALCLGFIPLVLFYKKEYFMKFFFSMVGVIILISAILLKGGIENSPRYISGKTKVSDQKRVAQFRAAMYAGKENPIFGLGPKQFKYHSVELKEKYKLPRINYKSHAHNVFLEKFANLGFPGLILFLMFIFFWIAEVNLLPNPVRSIFLPFIFVFLIASQFEYVFDANNSFFFFFIYSLSKVDYWKLRNESK